MDGSQARNSLILAVIGLVFSGMAAFWSLIGGACCGWGGWPLAIVGLACSAFSLHLRRNVIGWIAMALGVFAFAWVLAGAAMLRSLIG